MSKRSTDGKLVKKPVNEVKKGKNATKVAPSPADLSMRFYHAILAAPDPRNETEGERRMALSLIHHIVDLYRKKTDITGAMFDLHATEIYVLSMLLRINTDHLMKVVDLRNSLGFTSGGVTRLLDRMAAANLITRIADPDDQRGWLVQLTSKGKSLAERIMDERMPKIRRMHAELNPDEWRVLKGLLERIRDQMADL
jgi:DNA-binding MarR family transcriptional regulator